MHVIGQAVASAVSSVKVLVARVYGIVSHHEMHDDEFMARWFLRTFGADKLPGICDAPLQLVDSGIRLLRGKTGAEWFAAGYPCLGTCGGPLDEHDLPVDERTNASAATLAAKMLGVDQYAPVQAMLAHAVRVDRTPTASAFDISAIIKAMHRAGVPIAKMCTLYDRIAAAWFTVLSGKVRNATWEQRPTLDQLAAEWIVNHLSAEDYDRTKRFATAFDAAVDLKMEKIHTLRPLLRYFSGEYQSNIKSKITGVVAHDHLFELNGIVDALNMDNAEPEVVRDIVFTALHAKLAEQIRFMAGFSELKALRKAGTLTIKGTPLRIMLVTSDNPEINRAARKLDPHHDAFIQRNTDGHVVIWYNRLKLNMDGVASRLRLGDRKARRMPALSLDSMRAEGTLPEAPWWYYNPTSGQIMNGSRTNRGAPVTELDDNALVRCVVYGWVAVGRAQ